MKCTRTRKTKNLITNIIRFNTENEKLIIGESRLDHGLYELLFRRNSKNFTEEDIDNYKHMVLNS